MSANAETDPSPEQAEGLPEPVGENLDHELAKSMSDSDIFPASEPAESPVDSSGQDPAGEVADTTSESAELEPSPIPTKDLAQELAAADFDDETVDGKYKDPSTPKQPRRDTLDIMASSDEESFIASSKGTYTYTALREHMQKCKALQDQNRANGVSHSDDRFAEETSCISELINELLEKCETHTSRTEDGPDAHLKTNCEDIRCQEVIEDLQERNEERLHLLRAVQKVLVLTHKNFALSSRDVEEERPQIEEETRIEEETHRFQGIEGELTGGLGRIARLEAENRRLKSELNRERSQSRAEPSSRRFLGGHEVPQLQPPVLPAEVCETPTKAKSRDRPSFPFPDQPKEVPEPSTSEVRNNKGEESELDSQPDEGCSPTWTRPPELAEFDGSGESLLDYHRSVASESPVTQSILNAPYGAVTKVLFKEETNAKLQDWKNKAEAETQRAEEAVKQVANLETRLEDERDVVAKLRKELEECRAQVQLSQSISSRPEAVATFDESSNQFSVITYKSVEVTPDHDGVKRPWSEHGESPGESPRDPLSMIGHKDEGTPQHDGMKHPSGEHGESPGDPCGGSPHDSKAHSRPTAIHSMLREEILAWFDVYHLFVFLITWPMQRMLTAIGKCQQGSSPAGPDLPFRPTRLLRFVRYLAILLTVNAYLSFELERLIWVQANARTRVHVLEHLHDDSRWWWWSTLGLKTQVSWEKLREVSAMVTAHTMDMWMPWAGRFSVEWMKGVWDSG
ncbi:hypothetical protein HIM_04774 [Hirsutella minnesotensis 3608]|uniref:Uncharacterized protein n=1 Tax=Hirsutella minnesotensis 3608 TaxID=1043627 RepID=A0A0F7ZPR3_9HYPO|nr:hypothetical protein HIM_04774 [Hirsutella minnesotensis 3608]